MKFSELSTRFGEDIAIMICEELGGDTVYIPKAEVPRHREVTRLWLKGTPATAIAERLGCSRQYVNRCINNL